MRTTVPLRKAKMREKQQERGHEVEGRKLMQKERSSGVALSSSGGRRQ